MSRRSLVLSLALTVTFGFGSSVMGQEYAENSYSVTVDGTTYDFTYVTSGTYWDNRDVLQSTPWYGDIDLATSMAQQYGAGAHSDLGLDYGPYFVYGETVFDPSNPAGSTYAKTVFYTSQFNTVRDTLENGTRNYAAVPVPEINGNTIPLLAFIFSVMALGLRGRLGSPLQSIKHPQATA